MDMGAIKEQQHQIPDKQPQPTQQFLTVEPPQDIAQGLGIGVGLGLKAAEGWELVCPCCLVNGSEAYFPMRECYEEGGYEARSSSMKAGCAELIIEEGTKLLDGLR